MLGREIKAELLVEDRVEAVLLDNMSATLVRSTKSR